jgi:hypothetical protein
MRVRGPAFRGMFKPANVHARRQKGPRDPARPRGQAASSALSPTRKRPGVSATSHAGGICGPRGFDILQQVGEQGGLWAGWPVWWLRVHHEQPHHDYQVQERLTSRSRADSSASPQQWVVSPGATNRVDGTSLLSFDPMTGLLVQGRIGHEGVSLRSVSWCRVPHSAHLSCNGARLSRLRKKLAKCRGLHSMREEKRGIEVYASTDA